MFSRYLRFLAPLLAITGILCIGFLMSGCVTGFPKDDYQNILYVKDCLNKIAFNDFECSNACVDVVVEDLNQRISLERGIDQKNAHQIRFKFHSSALPIRGSEGCFAALPLITISKVQNVSIMTLLEAICDQTGLHYIVVKNQVFLYYELGEHTHSLFHFW